MKKVGFRWISYSFHKLSTKQIRRKYNGGASKDPVQQWNKSWISAYVQETKQKSTVWVFQNDESRQKLFTLKHVKTNSRLFFGKSGHVATEHLEERRMIICEWYTTIGLPDVFGEIMITNKCCHTCRLTTN